jgi:hypothetical protein
MRRARFDDAKASPNYASCCPELRLIATQVFAEIGGRSVPYHQPEMQMSNRTAKFVSAVFASILAGAPLATISHGAEPAADDCLSAPKGPTPSGGHWYYRIDRATKRHCWYIGDEKQKLSRVAPKNSAPVTDPGSPQNEPAAQRSIADARAELPWPQTRVEPETGLTAGQLNPAAAANAASVENSQLTNAWDANTQRSVVASRWPEQSGVSSSASPEPTGNSDATEQSNSEPAPSPAIAAVSLAAADLPSEKPSGSIRMLLIVIIGALSFAGLIGSVIFRLGSKRRAGRRQIRGDRRAIWDAVDIDRPPPTAYPRADVSPRADIPLMPRGVDDPNDRIVDMLQRLSRSAAN